MFFFINKILLSQAEVKTKIISSAGCKRVVSDIFGKIEFHFDYESAIQNSQPTIFLIKNDYIFLCKTKEMLKSMKHIGNWSTMTSLQNDKMPVQPSCIQPMMW